MLKPTPKVVEGNCAVAVFDILGFKSLIKRMKYSELPQIMECIIRIPMEASVEEDAIGSFVVADTIILYTRYIFDGMPFIPFALVRSCRNLLEIFASEKMPIRGALTAGHLYVDEERGIIIGPAYGASIRIESYSRLDGSNNRQGTRTHIPE